ADYLPFTVSLLYPIGNVLPASCQGSADVAILSAIKPSKRNEEDILLTLGKIYVWDIWLYMLAALLLITIFHCRAFIWHNWHKIPSSAYLLITFILNLASLSSVKSTASRFLLLAWS